MPLPFFQAFFAAFAVMDPLGNAPIFLALTEKMERRAAAELARNAVLLAAGLLAVFVFLGSGLLEVFRISIESFRIAGGIVMGLLGLQILFGGFGHDPAAHDGRDLSVVPLATPLIAGPGMITTSVILAKEYGYLMTLAALCANLLLTWLCFRNAARVFRLFGRKGATVFAKVMGLILLALGVEFIRAAL